MSICDFERSPKMTQNEKTFRSASFDRLGYGVISLCKTTHASEWMINFQLTPTNVDGFLWRGDAV
jgi:hypothetical protein